MTYHKGYPEDRLGGQDRRALHLQIHVLDPGGKRLNTGGAHAHGTSLLARRKHTRREKTQCGRKAVATGRGVAA